MLLLIKVWRSTIRSITTALLILRKLRELLILFCICLWYICNNIVASIIMFGKKFAMDSIIDDYKYLTKCKENVFFSETSNFFLC